MTKYSKEVNNKWTGKVFDNMVTDRRTIFVSDGAQVRKHKTNECLWY